MDDHYYKLVRKEIDWLLPDPIGRVLEVGCASGATLRWLRGERRAEKTVGVEINADLSELLAANVDVPLVGDAAQVDRAAEHGPYDLILFLDVLEHLVDPWTTLRDYRRLLSPTGSVIVSVPNIAHLGIVKGLLRSRFSYRDDGILDRTHLRFFVLPTTLELVEGADLKVDRVTHMLGPQRRLTRWLHAATLGRLKNGLAIQHIVRGVPADRFNGDVVQKSLWHD
jgi:2-polyprenyl-3-methyl-5-hydroxy-6-metoxy-1,4-benzoquinol methylase